MTPVVEDAGHSAAATGAITMTGETEIATEMTAMTDVKREVQQCQREI